MNFPSDNIVADRTKGGIWVIGVYGILGAVYSCTKPFFLTSAGDYKKWEETGEMVDKAYSIADKLAWRTNGENKFLRMIHVQLEVKAPRAWWSHYDTYKVGTVAQSESTMHTLKKRGVVEDDFETGTSLYSIHALQAVLSADAPISEIKYNVPDGFLQSRVLDLNYANLQTMWYQRHTQEKLNWWKTFLALCDVLPHPEWIRKVDATGRSRVND